MGTGMGEYMPEELGQGEQELFATVDWITATTRDGATGYFWQEVYQEQREKADAQKLLTTEKRWKFMSYEGSGYPGSIRVGYSEQLGWIAIASSGGAEKWEKLVGSSSSVTRIDLAVTQHLLVEIADVPKMYYEALADAEKSRRNYALIQNTKRGQTLYVGSRRSQKFGRLYDKGVESKTALPGFRYRWEVEFKKPTSGDVARALVALKGKQAEQITAMVYEFFDNRGIHPLFPKTGNAVALRTEARITSLDRKLNWIRAQVRPSIGEIIMAGRSRDLFEAFGVKISDEYLEDLEERAERQRRGIDEVLDNP